MSSTIQAADEGSAPRDDVTAGDNDVTAPTDDVSSPSDAPSQSTETAPDNPTITSTNGTPRRAHPAPDTISSSNGSAHPLASAVSTSSARAVLAPSRLAGFGGGGVGSSTAFGAAPSLLKPSKLFLGSGSGRSPEPSGFTLKPSKLAASNPFAKMKYEEPSSSEAASKGDTPPDSPPSASKPASSLSSTADCTSSTSSASGLTVSSSSSSAGFNLFAAAKASSSSEAEKAAEGSSSIFGIFNAGKKEAKGAEMISQSSATTNGGSAQSSGGSFVFGQNLQSRVSGTDEVSTNGTAGSEAAASSANLFSAAASNISAEGSSEATANGSVAAAAETKSLETSSRELAEKESREKRKFDEVEVITGEETESNVLQMAVKLYQFVGGAYKERGRGTLRLNDWGQGGDDLRSRLVVRTQGTLTVMLNTKIWSGMSVQRASDKSVRLTATGQDGAVAVYLVMGQQRDVDLLTMSLECRVRNAPKEPAPPADPEAKRAKTDA